MKQAPNGLCSEAVHFYNELIEELERQQVIQQLDQTVLELAATSYHLMHTSRQSLLEKGITYEAMGHKGDVLIKLNPAYKIFLDAQIQLLKIINELGMSPKSRKQLKEINSPPDVDSPLKQFLQKETRSN